MIYDCYLIKVFPRNSLFVNNKNNIFYMRVAFEMKKSLIIIKE
jgi:hypothetical protein